MKLYLDSAYILKCYLREADSESVMQIVSRGGPHTSSQLCVAEISAGVHRSIREKRISHAEGTNVLERFRSHVSDGQWEILPVSSDILTAVADLFVTLPASCFLRAADAIHLVSAQSAGFKEIWSNDQHLLSGAKYCKLRGRSV